MSYIPLYRMFKTLDVIRAHDDTLEFQFRLVDGVIDNSFAAVTALKMGIPAHVVQRSDEASALRVENHYY